MIIIKDISWSGCTRKDKALKKEEKKSKWFHTQSASGQVGLVAAHNLIQSSQQDAKLTYRAVITLSEKLYHLHFKAGIKGVGFLCLCVLFLCGVFYFCFVFFLVQHNLERLKAFQPKCGEKTGTHSCWKAGLPSVHTSAPLWKHESPESGSHCLNLNSHCVVGSQVARYCQRPAESQASPEGSR